MEFKFAFSGEEALKVLDGIPHETVLILSDINMPGMSGLELLKKIKSGYKVPPPVVMMVTAYGDEENHKTAKDLGADDFLTKPIVRDVLLQTVAGVYADSNADDRTARSEPAPPPAT